MPAPVGAELDDQARIGRIIEVYGALARRDFVALQRLVGFDVALHVSGSSWLSGTFEGMGAVMALGTKIGNRLLQGESELHDIGVRDGRVEADVTVCIPVRGEDEPFRAKLHESFALDASGHVEEIWIEAADQARFDRFIGF